jgi:rhamnosyltransferase
MSDTIAYSVSETQLPSVAVLMASYNGEKFIAQQVESIFSQSDVHVTLYVRDDGSTDGTIALLKEFQKKGWPVIILPSDKRLGAAKNFLCLMRDVSFDRHDFVGYADQDDIWMPAKLISAISAMQKNAADCYASNLIMCDAAARPVKRSMTGRIRSYIFNYKSNRQLPYDFYFESASAGCTLLLSAAAAKGLQQTLRRYFDDIPPDASHDWSTYAITRLLSFTWFIDSKAYILYRQHTGNAYGANLGIQSVKKLLKLFTSGWYRAHILMIDRLFNHSGKSPRFIGLLTAYQSQSFMQRVRLAFSVCRYRRKTVHRILLFLMIVLGFFR